MIQDTSTKAYREDALPTLSQRHSAVMNALGFLTSATNSELAHYLGWPINTVTPRIHELRKLGKVADLGKRSCEVTGRTAYVWTINSDQQKLPI